MGTVYDLIVIGSGPAGQRAAIYGAKMGKKIALVEMREVVGGACINTGTIPSKTMREAVLHLSGYNYKSIYGMNYRVKERITMADLAFRVQHVIKTEIDVTEAQLSRNNIEMLVGVASFEDPTHVKVTNSKGSTVYEAKNVLIATGTKPASSPKVPINGTTIINSDLVLNLVNLPKTMIIVGGGVIGVEYCCMFAAMGVRAVFLSTTDTGASKETTARKSRLGGTALISTAKYPRVVFAVITKLQRVVRLEDLGTSGPGDDVRRACLEENELAASVDVATQLQNAGIQGIIFPSVVKGGDDNLIVYVANCDPDALQIQNEDRFIEQAKKIAAKPR